jgi:hypothetical protein
LTQARDVVTVLGVPARGETRFLSLRRTSGPSEMKQTATVLSVSELLWVAVLDQSPLGVDRREINKVEPTHCGHESIRARDPVGVEADALTAHGKP